MVLDEHNHNGSSNDSNKWPQPERKQQRWCKVTTTTKEDLVKIAMVPSNHDHKEAQATIIINLKQSKPQSITSFKFYTFS